MFTFPKRKLIRAPIGTRVTNGIGYQYLFLRRGKEIEYICYLGPENLEDHVEEIIGDLDN